MLQLDAFRAQVEYVDRVSLVSCMSLRFHGGFVCVSLLSSMCLCFRVCVFAFVYVSLLSCMCLCFRVCVFAVVFVSVLSCVPLLIIYVFAFVCVPMLVSMRMLSFACVCLYVLMAHGYGARFSLPLLTFLSMYLCGWECACGCIYALLCVFICGCT